MTVRCVHGVLAFALRLALAALFAAALAHLDNSCHSFAQTLRTSGSNTGCTHWACARDALFSIAFKTCARALAIARAFLSLQIPNHGHDLTVVQNL